MNLIAGKVPFVHPVNCVYVDSLYSLMMKKYEVHTIKFPDVFIMGI